jgi:hypothetical protein
VKIINPGTFSSNYELYTISTPLTDWVVKRRQSHFFELREHLVKRYPGYIVPSLPKKINKKFTTESMNKYIKLLQLFLNDLLDHPLLRETKLLHSFLTVKNENTYERMIKELTKATVPKDITEFTTKTGIASININRKLIKLVNEITSGSKAISINLNTYLFI